MAFTQYDTFKNSAANAMKSDNEITITLSIEKYMKINE